MKKTILTLTLNALLAVTVLISCDTETDRVADQRDNMAESGQEARQDAIGENMDQQDAQNMDQTTEMERQASELRSGVPQQTMQEDRALSDNPEEFRAEATELITEYEEDIAELRENIQNQREEIRPDFEQRINELEEKNQELREQVTEYQHTSEEEWQSFRQEIDQEMNEIESSLNSVRTELN